jgi:hypothetical protein
MALSKDNVGKQVIYNDTEKEMYITGEIVRYYKDEDNNEEFYAVSIWPSREVIRLDNDTYLTIV